MILALLPPDWATGLLATSLYALLGIVLAIIGFRLFDWATPGKLNEEIFEKKNTAAAILGAALILGICLIIAAAISG